MARTATTIALLGLAASPAAAFFLMPCWPVSTQRIDPIVNPGEMSAHVHQIAGGDAFAPAMTYEDTQNANCTTCFVSKDKSNYWIPALYHEHTDGTFERVPQVGSASMYYFNEKHRLGAGETMEAFPKGLRMLAGDPNKRTGGDDAASQALNYKCLDYSGVPTDSKTFPDKPCPNGVRAEVTFPSCWDGENLDSSDHKSHMAFPTGTFESGSCPSTHPHHLVTLKVEFIFDTNKFQWSGEQPFRWSDGDPTGFGLHADFFMGWDTAVLQNAVDSCFDINGVLANCGAFDGLLPPQDQQWMNPGTCVAEDFVDEEIGAPGSPIAAMPGCNAISWSTPVKAACNSAAKLIGDWSWAVKNKGSSSSGSSSGSSYSGSGSGSNSDSSSSSSSSAAAQAHNFYAADSATTPPAAPATTASPAPPPPSPTAPPKEEWGNVVIVTNTVYETIEATATAYAQAKRDVHQHLHRHAHGHARRRIGAQH